LRDVPYVYIGQVGCPLFRVHTQTENEIMYVFCSDYCPYLEALPIIAAPSQSLFWSGTFSIVGVISKNDLGATVVSSANADASEIINYIESKAEGWLNWCGRKYSEFRQIQSFLPFQLGVSP
jgi:hypothetical protein